MGEKFEKYQSGANSREKNKNSLRQVETNDVQRNRKENLPEYEENFGHLAESIIRSLIKKKASLFVEKVERATKTEDRFQVVDFWIKFVGEEEPIGIQYTVSDNEEVIKKKLEILRSRNFLAKKEKREDSEINWSGTANVVLIRGDKRKLAKIEKESREKNIDPAELVDSSFLVDFFNQLRIGLEEANPVRKEIVFSLMKDSYKKDPFPEKKGTRYKI